MKTMLPSLYTPKCPEDFVGPAAQVACMLRRIVEDSLQADRAPIKVLLNGDPGIGKSALAKFLVQELGCDPKWSTTKLNGTQVNIDRVEQIANDLHYRDMFGSYRMLWIEEADKVTPAAQVRLLTLLDDLPNGCAVVCTSNCKLDEFQKRFQTRFKVFELEPPSAEDIRVLLGKFLTDKQAIIQIATFACGNVRAALLDAELAMQASLKATA